MMEEKIIKARSEGEAASSSAKVVKREVFEATVEARQIVETAQKRAQAILDEAERNRDSMIEAGRQQGYEQGLALFDETLRGLRTAQQALQAKCEPELIRMAVKIAEKIIGEELRTRPEAIVSITRECLRVVQSERSVTIRVNPSEKDEVLGKLDSLARVIGPGRQVQVLPDPLIKPFGCVVESDNGVVDGQLETQLKCLADILLRVAARR